MNRVSQLLIPFIFGLLVLTLVNCKNPPSEDNIVGLYVAEDKNNMQEIVYNITHIKDNIYGIKVDVSFDGSESQTDYLEGSYNPEVRILTTKRSNVILNYQFSQDYGTIELLGDENDIKLRRK